MYLLPKDFDRQGSVKPSDLRPDDFEGDYVSSANGPYPSYPLYGYSALFWMDHTEANAFDTVISNLRSQLFDVQETDQFLFWAHAWVSNSRILAKIASVLTDHIHDVTPLHLACPLRIADLVDQLIREGANVNQNSFLLASPLECAICGLECSVDSGNPWKPSDGARHQTIRRLLRENPISSDIFYPIAYGLCLNKNKSVQILLEHGFPLKSQIISRCFSIEGIHKLLDLGVDLLQPHVQRSIQRALSLYGVRDSARTGEKHRCSEILVHSY
ncbi:hypothetical protein B0J12DRAFT_176179 [Macrophomina phaseolina]|uniref:Ankyrin repeat-containing domain protein n=1 Tax=Macrophomina phaseolina TaxID=35725 RepID=A0ABQ8GW42_9PEZI|nr:hypothetical protein B0J12DRAFT_176179 [Macrophomina phaseolina]